MDIGNTIKALRKKRGINQVELAKKANLSQSYLSLIENGSKEPTLSVLKQIANMLEVPLPVLIFFSLEEDDVSKPKREAYRMLKPSIMGLIDDVFNNNEKKK